MNFSNLFRVRSWQSILAADLHAQMGHQAKTTNGERRINLLDYEGSLEHMLLLVRTRNGGRRTPSRHLIAGASAHLTFGIAPDIRLNAGVSNFWQKLHGSEAKAPGRTATGSPERPK